MAKIAFVTDLHISAGKGEEIISNSQMKFFRKQFIPYLRANNINTIVMPGDIFDNRHAINVRSLHEAIDLFAEDLKDFDIHMICGNHDLFYKETTKVHSTRILSEMDHITVYNTISDINLLGLDILMVPWITDQEHFDSRIRATNAKVCVGHFDIKSFRMTKGYISDHGLEPEFFSKFDLTISGHYHFRDIRNLSNGGQLHYIGNAYHLNRNDSNDPDRGFAILETEDLSMQYINNTVSTKFMKIAFPEQFTESFVANNIIDVLVEYSDDFDQSALTEYLELMQSYKPVTPPKIVPSYKNDFIKEKTIDSDYIFTTIDKLLITYIETLDDLDDKDEVKDMLNELYTECKGA